MKARKYRRAYVWVASLVFLGMLCLCLAYVSLFIEAKDFPYPLLLRVMMGTFVGILIFCVAVTFLPLWRKLSGPHVDDDFPAGAAMREWGRD
jgi:hypothetical protein